MEPSSHLSPCPSTHTAIHPSFPLSIHHPSLHLSVHPPTPPGAPTPHGALRWPRGPRPSPYSTATTGLKFLRLGKLGVRGWEAAWRNGASLRQQGSRPQEGAQGLSPASGQDAKAPKQETRTPHAWERDGPPRNCRGRTSYLLHPPSYGRGALGSQGAGSNQAAPWPLGPLKSLSLPGKGRNHSDPVDETPGRHSHRPATLVAKRHVSLN